MRSRFMSGIIAGSLFGVTASMYALYKTSPRQRRRIMKKGTRAIRDASKFMGAVSSLNLFR
ncbi:hypothetical protein SAMN02745883_00312 [Caminicella sporogenes DSM 14501]|uniref:YtxH-like protein n=1 Tax=Caminicella sporogenes DSM 14501 TaxID=1121266 RepID=A0A1M6LR68_9FIRM|nr:hypothetical protein [Caminicella sporogenes]RKD27920.1 hypothetical protein BET04_02345 [Caminicella sporogenes]WIF94489.1 hypothetical protein QNI18_09490 [Caminicella sporogenes]SHJ73661.1 hypothetical protein SAMN02745883_00312 [Caminicella sporogenes DSM 14501]